MDRPRTVYVPVAVISPERRSAVPGQSPAPREPRTSRLLWACALMGAVALVAFVVTFATGTLTAGTAAATVPDLAGRTQQNALAALERAGLTPGSIGKSQKGAEVAGTVVAQDARPGSRLDKGAAVSFTVSAGAQPSLKKVPGVVGGTRRQAEKALRAAGFQVLVAMTPDWSKAGTVLAQAPFAGAVAWPGSAVGLIVSTGKVPPMSRAGGFP